MPILDSGALSSSNYKEVSENKGEHNGFTGELGIGFVEAVSMPIKGAAQLAGFKVDVAANKNSDAEQTAAEKSGYAIGAGIGNAALYIGATALAHKVPIIGKQAVIAAGAGLGFLNPTAQGEGIETRAANALIAASTNAIMNFGPGAVGKAGRVGESFLTSLERTTISSAAAGLFNTQAESLLHTGRPADLQESVSGTLAWAGTGAAFHIAGASFSGRRAAAGLNADLDNTHQLNLMPSPKFVRNPESQRQMAKNFSADVEASLKLQAETGPWIAVLGSSAPKPGSPTYKTAYEIGELVATKLKMPVATGNGPGVMEAANKGAFDRGGSSVGIYLEGLPSEQNQNPFTTKAIRCKTLLARQDGLLYGADGIVIAPEGGGGTVFEFTHQLIEMRRKVYNPETPIVFVDNNGMWSQFRGWLGRNVIGRGLMNGNELNHTFIAHSPAEAIDILGKHLPQTRANVIPLELKRPQPITDLFHRPAA